MIPSEIFEYFAQVALGKISWLDLHILLNIDFHWSEWIAVSNYRGIIGYDKDIKNLQSLVNSLDLVSVESILYLKLPAGIGV